VTDTKLPVRAVSWRKTSVRCRLRSRVRAGMELPASDPVLTPLANAPAQEAQSPTESTEFVWEMTGGAPNPPFFFHTGLRHMAWKDFGGSHNTVVLKCPGLFTSQRAARVHRSDEGALSKSRDTRAMS
jgi:hypothetical protein